MRVPIEEIYEKVIKWLREELPDYLKYHCPEHTMYVFKKATYIAGKEGVTAHELYLIQTAALLHDTGFVKQYEDHEEVGCKLAIKRLPEYGFDKKEIDMICGMIMATKIPQQPKNLLEMILADADLEYLATNLFGKVGDLLLEELRYFNPKLSRKEWNKIQTEFMSEHTYHTAYCRRYKEHRKWKNIQKLA